jgi:hypothetical protein
VEVGEEIGEDEEINKKTPRIIKVYLFILCFIVYGILSFFV